MFTSGICIVMAHDMLVLPIVRLYDGGPKQPFDGHQ
jgi:hypothetical protein